MTKFITNKSRTLESLPPGITLKWNRVDWAKLFSKTQWTQKRTIHDRALSDFFDHLATLLESGIPLIKALEFVSGSTKNVVLGSALRNIVEEIRAGKVFSEALTEHPRIFDRVVIGMMKAAEISGTMDRISAELAAAYNRRAELRERVSQAMAYPLLVAGFGILTVFALMLFVIPQLASVFKLWDAPIPPVTQFLLDASEFVRHGGMLIMIAVGVGLTIYLRRYHQERIKKIAQWLLVHTPVISRVYFLNNFVRLVRTWEMLQKSGVPILEVLRASQDVITDEVMQQSVGVILQKMRNGERFYEAISEETWMPQLACDFILIGEQTGTLEASFLKIATYYERRLNNDLKIMTTLLEPVMILLIGVIIGFLVVNLLVPIFEMSLSVH